MRFPSRYERTVGRLIQQWRRTRRMSQMELSGESGVSTRHLSFVESGRARPSRELVLRLSAALAVPRRERNDLLLAAGFAPAYRETPIDAPEMAEVLQALTMILERHAPFPAVALDGRWDILMANPAYAASVNACGPAALNAPPVVPLALLPRPRPNLLRLLCHPEGFRNHLDNWAEAATAVRRMTGEAESPIAPRRVLPPVEVERRFPEPVARTTYSGTNGTLFSIVAFPNKRRATLRSSLLVRLPCTSRVATDTSPSNGCTCTWLIFPSVTISPGWAKVIDASAI